MEGFVGLFGLMGVLISVGIPIVMIILFVMLVTSTKRQEALLTEILAELKKKETSNLNQ
jgi:hypothetical protein